MQMVAADSRQISALQDFYYQLLLIILSIIPEEIRYSSCIFLVTLAREDVQITKYNIVKLLPVLNTLVDQFVTATV